MAETRIIHGFHAVLARIRQNAASIREIYLDAARDDRRARELKAMVEGRGLRLVTVDARRLDGMTGQDRHQGVAARVDGVAPYPYADPDALLEGPAPLVVALDGVTDPHNLGAIARSAECAGADGLVVPRHGSAIVTAAVAKASAGAVEHLPIAVAPNLADWLGRAKRPGLWTYAAAADGAVPYADADYTDGCVFVLGAEGAGLRPRVRAACDAAVALPIAGRIDSLNVSVTAGVLLYEAVRQRRAG